MQDVQLNRILEALDAVAVLPGARTDVAAALELARLRLQCISSRVGASAHESPYLGFLRRTLAMGAPAPLAATA